MNLTAGSPKYMLKFNCWHPLEFNWSCQMIYTLSFSVISLHMCVCTLCFTDVYMCECVGKHRYYGRYESQALSTSYYTWWAQNRKSRTTCTCWKFYRWCFANIDRPIWPTWPLHGVSRKKPRMRRNSLQSAAKKWTAKMNGSGASPVPGTYY